MGRWIAADHAALLRFHATWADVTESRDVGPVLVADCVQLELGPRDVTARFHRRADEALLWACCESLRREFGTATAINADDLEVVDPAEELGDAMASYGERLPHPI